MIRKLFNDGWEYRPKAVPFDDSSYFPDPWVPVTLPHDAAIGLPRDPDAVSGRSTGYFPGGVYEYRTKLPVPEDYRDKRVTIEFEGVYRHAMVYINGEFAGQQPNGYSGFAIRADHHLRYGEDNEIRVECRSHEDSRWYSGIGIYRDVHLIVGESTHIALDGVRVTTPDIDADGAIAAVAAVIENDGMNRRTVDVVTEIRDPQGRTVATDTTVATVLPGEPATVRQRLLLDDPALWSVDTPHLYTATVHLRDTSGAVDHDVVAFGIRALRLDAKRGLRINGEPVDLRGTCLHHDSGILGAATFARAEERRIQLLKDAGFNAIRSAHNPLARATLDACDRIGMLVMDELCDMWTTNKRHFDYALDFPTWWERDVEAMVRKDRNHPSVIMYSIGNEIPDLGSPSGAVWSRRLAEKVRSLDDTRYITNGVNAMFAIIEDLGRDPQLAAAAENSDVNTMMAQVGERLNEIMSSDLVTTRTTEPFAVLDVAGMNYLDERYEKDRELFPHRVIVGTETFPGRIDTNWRLVRDNPHVIGDFTWTGWDYLGEAAIGAVTYADQAAAGPAHAFPALTAWCGDIDITGHRRPVSYWRETVFGLRHEPYIAVRNPAGHGRQTTSGPWSWTDSAHRWDWADHKGAAVTVEVYSDADHVELLLNDTSLGTAPAGEAHRFRAEFDTAYQPGELVAVAYKDGIEQARTRLVTPGETVELRTAADRTDLRADGTDLAYIALVLTDPHGIPHHGRDIPVTITVTGPGVLQGLGSANPHAHEPYTANTHTTWEGRALAVIRPTGPGTVTVNATAPGCDPATVTLHAT